MADDLDALFDIEDDDEDEEDCDTVAYQFVPAPADGQGQEMCLMICDDSDAGDVMLTTGERVEVRVGDILRGVLTGRGFHVQWVQRTENLH